MKYQSHLPGLRDRVTYLPVLVNPRAHDVALLAVQREHREAVAAGHVPHALRLGEPASCRSMHRLQRRLLPLLRPEVLGDTERAVARHAPREHSSQGICGGVLVDCEGELNKVEQKVAFALQLNKRRGQALLLGNFLSCSGSITSFRYLSFFWYLR